MLKIESPIQQTPLTTSSSSPRSSHSVHQGLQTRRPRQADQHDPAGGHILIHTVPSAPGGDNDGSDVLGEDEEGPFDHLVGDAGVEVPEGRVVDQVVEGYCAVEGEVEDHEGGGVKLGEDVLVEDGVSRVLGPRRCCCLHRGW